MKKITKIFAVTLTVAVFTFAQTSVKAQAFNNGDLVANLGAGFGWYSYGYGVSSLPALSVSMEKGIKEISGLDGGVFSVGGIVGFKHATYAWSSAYDYSWTDYVVAARGAIHANLLHVDKLDTYGGLAVGLRFEQYHHYDYVGTYPNYTYEKVNDMNVHPLFAFYIGGRYYFTEKIAGFGELGYGLGYFTLGLSFKLK